MSLTATEWDELAGLLDGICREEHDPAQTQRLQALANNCPDSRELFLHTLQVHAALQWHFRDEISSLNVSTVALQPSSPILQFFGRGASGISRPLVGSVLLVAACFYGVFTLIAWNLQSQITTHLKDRLSVTTDVKGSASGAIARLTATQDCRWEGLEKSFATGEELPARAMTLAAGVAELTFADGAQVTINGPTRFEPLSSGQMKLHAGRLLAQVPKQAIGFTVETPTAKVVDLGTEFGVEVGESGATDVHVSKGRVELWPGRQTKNASSLTPVTLSAGSARRIELAGPNSELTIREIDARSTPLPHRVGSAMFQIKVRGARASSEYPFRGAHNLINGSGLHAGEHDGQRLDTMWLTYGEHKQNNYVIFDLGQRHRVEKMKVWNYNERAMGVFKSRGVKRADIYISDSGKWDPLARPEEWKLVIAGQEFSAADGSDHYATSDVIDLGNIEARFVAILIHERLAYDSSQPDSYYVGLSEVQFFGERILAPPRGSK